MVQKSISLGSPLQILLSLVDMLQFLNVEDIILKYCGEVGL